MRYTYLQFSKFSVASPLPPPRRNAVTQMYFLMHATLTQLEWSGVAVEKELNGVGVSEEWSESEGRVEWQLRKSEVGVKEEWSGS